MEEKKQGRRVLRWVGVFFFLAMFVVVFLSARSTRGISMDMDSIDDGNSLRALFSTEGPPVQCFEFFRMHKKICMHPGSELVSGGSDKTVLDTNFIVMVKIPEGDGRIPQISWLEVVRFPTIPLVFVRLSDGETEYGAGKGSTFEEAMINLSFNFLTQEEGDAVEGVSTNNITI